MSGSQQLLVEQQTALGDGEVGSTDAVDNVEGTECTNHLAYLFSEIKKLLPNPGGSGLQTVKGKDKCRPTTSDGRSGENTNQLTPMEIRRCMDVQHNQIQ